MKLFVKYVRISLFILSFCHNFALRNKQSATYS